MQTISSSQIRRILIILAGFFIPLSTAAANILCASIILFILFEGNYQQKFKILRSHPIAILSALLFLVMALGFIYTPVSLVEAGKMLDKYREFLYISFFILIFQDQRDRQWAMYAFIASVTVALFLSYLITITGWHIGKGTIESPFIFKNHITQSLLTALAAYFLAIQAWQVKNWWRWLFILWILFGIFNIICMSPGRTGYLILFCLIFLLFYHFYHLRGIIIGSLFLVIVSTLAYFSSEILRQRVNDIKISLEHYQQGQVAIESAELRLEFLINSSILAIQKPILGHGTGSFNYYYRQLAEKKGIFATTNPHNEYLMIMIQWGIVGLSLFIILLYAMWKVSNYLVTPQKMMAQGLVITIAVGCLVNCFWLDSTEGHIFAYLIGMFYGGLPLYEDGTIIV